MSDDRVAAVRAFNRFYTARIGVLRDGLLRTPHSLTEARVLYELGQREVTEVADLRREMDIDAGFLSRLLARLHGHGLVARERSADDARRQRVRLTEEGAAAFAELDRRSADEIGAVLDALPEDDQQRLVAAMDTVHDVLTQAPPAGALRPERPAPRRPRLDRPAPRRPLRAAVRLGRELRGARRTDRGRLRRGSHDPRREAAWIAEVDGEPAGLRAVRAPRGRRRPAAPAARRPAGARARDRRAAGRRMPALRPARRATPGSPCGPTTSCTRRAGSTSAPASSSSSPRPTTASATTWSSRPGRGRSRCAAQ